MDPGWLFVTCAAAAVEAGVVAAAEVPGAAAYPKLKERGAEVGAVAAGSGVLTA